MKYVVNFRAEGVCPQVEAESEEAAKAAVIKYVSGLENAEMEVNDVEVTNVELVEKE